MQKVAIGVQAKGQTCAKLKPDLIRPGHTYVDVQMRVEIPKECQGKPRTCGIVLLCFLATKDCIYWQRLYGRIP